MNVLQVEPFNRALSDLRADVMINGRRRDHGAERAHLEVRPADVTCQGISLANGTHMGLTTLTKRAGYLRTGQASSISLIHLAICI